MTVEASDSGAAAINACLRSCMKVYTIFQEESYSYDVWHRPVTTTEDVIYSGSAVIYAAEGDYTYLATNYHVVYNSKATDKISKNIHAYIYGSEDAPGKQTDGTISYGDYAITCEYVGGAASCDVAILKVKTADLVAVNPQATPVTVCYDYHVGETTYAIGNPDDEGISVTRGVVSVDSEYTLLSVDGTTRQYRSIRTDSDLTHGSSGGGLFNAKGELIGLNNSGSEDTQSINNSIPATILTGAADGIIYYANDGDESTVGTYKTLIGVTSVSQNSRYVYDESSGYGNIFEDVVVDAVTTGGIADRLGLKEGDRLVSLTINGKEYRATRGFVFSEALLTARAGDVIKINYDRSNEQCVTDEYTVTKSDLTAVE